MASLREVADAAGVGLGTASRALNGTGYVSEEKKKMILKAAEELHYRQNMSVPEPAEHHAGLAAKGKTGIVGLSVPDMEQPFFAGLLKYLEIELHKLIIRLGKHSLGNCREQIQVPAGYDRHAHGYSQADGNGDSQKQHDK